MIIGIEIRAGAIRAAAYGRFGRNREPQWEVEVPVTPPLADPSEAAERLSEPLRRLLDEVGRGRHSVAVAVPSAWCLYRVVSFPFRSRSRVEKTLHYSLEGRLPGAIEEYVVEPLGPIVPWGAEGSRMLVSACPRERIRCLLDAFQAAGVDPCVVQPALVAATQPLWNAQPGQSWLLRLDGDHCEAVLVRDGRPLTCQVQWLGGARAAGDGVREICDRTRLALRSARLTYGGEQADRVVLIRSDSMADLAAPLQESLGMAVERAEKMPADGALPVPRRMAQVAAKEKETAVNLRRGELAHQAFARQVERLAAVALALLILIVCLVGVYTVRQMLDAGRRIEALEESRRAALSRVGPEVTTYARLNAAVEQARRDALAAEETMTVSCLQRWHDLVSALEQADVDFELLDINQQRVRLKAVAPQEVDLERILNSAPGFRRSGDTEAAILQDGRVRVDMTLKYR